MCRATFPGSRLLRGGVRTAYSTEQGGPLTGQAVGLLGVRVVD